MLLGNLATVGEWLLLDQWRAVLPAAALVAVLYARFAHREWIPVRALSPLFAITAAGWGFFSVWGLFGLRYGIFLFPPYFVGCLAVLRAASRAALAPAAFSAGVFPLFVLTWHPRLPLTSQLQFAPDQNLGYLDMIAIGRESARYVEQNYPGAEIYGTVPEEYELSEPVNGYVSAPLRFAPCSEFILHPGAKQIIFRHDYAIEQIHCDRLVRATGARFHTRFVSNDKWVALFVVPGEGGVR
jgi:hypothetical protein